MAYDLWTIAERPLSHNDGHFFFKLGHLSYWLKNVNVSGRLITVYEIKLLLVIDFLLLFRTLSNFKHILDHYNPTKNERADNQLHTLTSIS